MVVPLPISSNDLAHLLPLHPWNAVQLPPHQLQVKSAGTTDGRSRLQQLHFSCQPPSAKKKVPSCREAKKFSAGLGFTSRSRAQTPPTPLLHFSMTRVEKVTAEATLHSKPQNKQANKLCEFHLKVTDDLLPKQQFAQGYTRSRLTSPVECLSVVQSFSFTPSTNSSEYIQSFFGVFCTLFGKTTIPAKFTIYLLFVPITPWLLMSLTRQPGGTQVHIHYSNLAQHTSQ